MAFGVDSDFWAFADTAGAILLQSSTLTPVKTVADCIDSNGDVSAATVYDSFIEYSATYKSCSDTALVFVDTGITFQLGTVISSKVITGIDVTTSNTDRPEITISGRTCTIADSLVHKYDMSDLEIAGVRKATPIGVTADTDVAVTGSTASATVSTAVVLDSDGAFACMDVYGGRVEATTDLAGCGADPGAAADTGWTISGGPSDAQENTGYSTGSITVFKNISQDT
ncbi:unnamed protein product [marine sediment metagenome]|uniref:Uncharacterized protein n=1 Tax=marine sediment metagenome TaxID=412755 RepID=X1AKW4_9ZZZZ